MARVSYETAPPGQAWYEDERPGVLVLFNGKVTHHRPEQLQELLDRAWQSFGDPSLTLEAQRNSALMSRSRRKR